MKFFEEEFDRASSFSELFELVKAVVRESLGKERSGLMLGLAELGVKPNGFIGAFYPAGSNLIVMNKTAAKLIEAQHPELYKAYCFHVLLHEYLHTLGFLDESNVRTIAHFISKNSFGENHPTVLVSQHFNELLNGMPFKLLNSFSPVGEDEKRKIEIVGDFDKSSTNYIG